MTATPVFKDQAPDTLFAGDQGFMDQLFNLVPTNAYDAAGYSLTLVPDSAGVPRLRKMGMSGIATGFNIDGLGGAGALAAGDLAVVSQGTVEKRVALSAVKTFMQDIAALTAAGALAGADLIGASQSGTVKKVTLTDLRTFAQDISGLSAAAALSDADLAFVSQSGVPKKVTLGNLGAGNGVYTPMSGNATLTKDSSRRQLFDPNGSNREVTLDATCNVTGTWFILANESQVYTITVKNSGGGVISTLNYRSSVTLFYTGTSWSELSLPDIASIGAHAYYGIGHTGSTYLGSNASHLGRVAITDTGVGVNPNGNFNPSYGFHVGTSGNANSITVDNTTGGVGICAVPHASAALNMASITQGFGLPVMSVGQRDAIASPKHMLMVACDTGSAATDSISYYNANAADWYELIGVATP